ERWRPFCPSMLDTVAPKMLKVDHPSPFMTFTFEVNEEWKDRVPEVVHEDGTSRAQVLERRHNPRWYDLMVELEKLTGNGVSLNTSLNRRGEPMVCSPTDALNMFYGSDLQYLIMEDVLVVREGARGLRNRLNAGRHHNPGCCNSVTATMDRFWIALVSTLRFFLDRNIKSARYI